MDFLPAKVTTLWERFFFFFFLYLKKFVEGGFFLEFVRLSLSIVHLNLSMNNQLLIPMYLASVLSLLLCLGALLNRMQASSVFCWITDVRITARLAQVCTAWVCAFQLCDNWWTGLCLSELCIRKIATRAEVEEIIERMEQNKWRGRRKLDFS